MKRPEGAEREPGEKKDRRKFLKQVGMSLAAGAGLSLVPFQSASAACCTCCRNSNCPFCPGSNVRYRCDCAGTAVCCICVPAQGNCFSLQECC